MPYDGFEYMDDNNVRENENDPNKFLNVNTSKQAVKGMWITADFIVPYKLKWLTDDMPLGMVNTEKIYGSPHTRRNGRMGGQRKLVAGHFSVERYGFHIKLLKFYISLGCIITKVHSIIEFDQKPLFEPYITHCNTQRRKAMKNNDPVLKRLYKLLANALYGKCLQSDTKYNTVSVLTEIGERYAKLCGQPRFKNRRWIVKDRVALVTRTKKEIYLTAPIFIGACVLQLAKLTNYSFHLQVAKASCETFPEIAPYPLRELDLEIIIRSREYIHSIYLVYADTDSLGYEIVFTEKAKNMTHDELFRKTFFCKYLDRSNFKVLSKESYCEAGEMGYIKSEVSDNIVHEVIALTPKCYSILSYERGSNTATTKFAIKGCPIRTGEKVYTHEVFRKVLEDREYQIPQAVSNHIRRDPETGVNTVRVSKTCLSILDNKRFWINDQESYGYAHPKTYEMGYKNGNIIAADGFDIKGTRTIDNELDVEEDISDIDEYEDGGDFFSEQDDDDDVQHTRENGETYNIDYDIDDENITHYKKPNT